MRNNEAHLCRIPITMIRIDLLSISFNDRDRPCIVFDDSRADGNRFNEPTKTWLNTNDESIRNPNATVYKGHMHSPTNLTSDCRHIMRRFYRNLKSSTGKGNKFESGRRCCRSIISDKLKVPQSKYPLIDEQPSWKEDQETLNANMSTRSTSLTLEQNAGGCLGNTSNDNTDDEMSSCPTKVHMDERMNELCSFQGMSDVPIGNFDDDVKEEEDSLLGLQFLSDDDDIDDHVSIDVVRIDMNFFFPLLSLNVDKSFCFSSDSDEYSTDTIDTSLGLSDSTKIYQ